MTKKIFPSWAPRLSKSIIKRLYDNDALGLIDTELIDKVGYGLYSRCKSFIQAVEASQGIVSCPVCDNKIIHNRKREFLLVCDSCAWELSWEDYFSTIQHKQLSGAEPVIQLFSSYINTFPNLKTPQEKMLQIDQLIHGFHIFIRNDIPTRPVAVNLIKGRLSDVVEFLENLSYSKSGTPGLDATFVAWKENLDTSKNWNKR